VFFMNREQLFAIFKTAVQSWLKSDAILRAAALTYFIILPLPTLLLIVVAVFSLFFGSGGAVGVVVAQIGVLAGPLVAGLFEQLLVSSASPFSGVWTAIVVVGFSVGGAFGAFYVLREGMDKIWGVKLPQGQPLWKRTRQKLVPFLVVAALGLIVIAWTGFANSLYGAIGDFSVNQVLSFVVLGLAQLVLSFVLALVLLAVIYKLLPEATVHWQDVALASVVGAVAFTVTNYFFGFYIQVFVVTTVGGAAGALLIILLWIYALNLIVLFGAEVSRVYALSVGTHAEQRLPDGLGRLVVPLQRAGERLEESVKEEVVKVDEVAGKLEREEVAEFGHAPKPAAEIKEPEVVETEPKPPEPAKPPENKPGSVRIEIKYTSPKKKKPKLES
jgi:membrane protein